MATVTTIKICHNMGDVSGYGNVGGVTGDNESGAAQSPVAVYVL